LKDQQDQQDKPKTPDDIFAKLEVMSHNETMFDGFDSDDSDTPPPFGPSKGKNDNNK